MKMEDVHAASKRFRIFDDSGNSGAGIATTAVVAKVEKKEKQLKEGEENGDVKSCAGRGVIADAAALGAMRAQWHPHSSAASRICRVSRASGGKDRHSKVLTAKGLRDRRVRLSVPTAIQFYDLQDRLGYDQPSKAVEWLIKAAAAAIADLPSLDATFPGEEIPIQVAVAGEQDEDAGAEVAELEQADQQKPQDPPHGSLTKSTCSSTSETSKGSVLSLSRSEIRVKARKRARERAATAKEKERDRDGGDEGSQFGSVEHHPCLNLHSSPQNSFIELLTCGGQQNQNHNQGPCTSLNPKQQRHSPASPAVVKTDFFGQMSLLGEGEKSHQPPELPSQAHFNIPTAAASATRDHPEVQQQQFSFMPEHLIPLAVTSAGGDYINFSITSGIAGFNRGTLQSNFAPPQSSHHHLQRLSSQVDGSNLPFFLGAATHATPASWDGHFAGGYDSRLHLCYDGYRNSDLKDKGKS